MLKKYYLGGFFWAPILVKQYQNTSEFVSAVDERSVWIQWNGVRPVKGTGTRWIDCKLWAIEQLVDKFGLYCQHIQHAITKVKNSKDHTTLQGKFEKLINKFWLLKFGFFSDILSANKIFSLTT